MSVYDRIQRGQAYEGWAFTFCKAAFLVLIFGKWSLLALSGLAALFYVVAQMHGVERWRCWAKPPWVTLFWAVVFVGQIWIMFIHKGPISLPGFTAGR
jgi:hypothetical protein